MAKPNNNILMKAVGVAVLGAASLSATQWQYSAPSLFEATSSFQSAGLETWGGQPALSMSASSSSSSGWGGGSIGPSATAWGTQSSTVYSDDVFRSYLYSGSSNADTWSGNGAFSSAWTTYNSNASSAGAWGASYGSSSSSWGGSSGWGGSADPWGSNVSYSGAWFTTSSSSYSGAWGGSSSSNWGSGGSSTSDSAACNAVTSWASSSSSSYSGAAPVWGGSYSAPAVSAPVSTCTSTISNLAPSTNLQPTNGTDLLTSTPDLEVFDSPEPSTWILLLSGAALVGVSRRKRSA